MKIVRIVCPKNQFILRQTPKELGQWGGYQFTFDEINDPDYLVIINNYGLSEIRCNCPFDSLIYLLQEPSDVSHYNNDNHSKEFLDNFGLVLTTQKSIIGNNITHSQIGAPWFIEKNFDQLTTMEPPLKNKLISIVTSNKTYTKGHRKRIEVAMKVKKYFGDSVDLFGRGFNTFDSKWDVLAPYKYHIAIENSSEIDYFTEKLIDPILSYTMPLYYGCPNILDYFSLPEIFQINELDSFSNLKNKVIYLLENENLYDSNFEFLKNARIDILYKYQLFPMLASFFDQTKKSDILSNTIIYKKKIDTKFKILHKLLRKYIFLRNVDMIYNKDQTFK
jgi:hypothetical protein